jgi:hypothetical protein
MSSNPLIQDLIENEAFPSVGVALPTGGRWYGTDVIDSDADPLDLTVGVLGILAEQNYRDPWLLLSGEAIPRMLKGVCPSILKAQELCELDLEAILLASRLVSYGPKLELTHKCQSIVPREIKKDEKPKKVEKPKEGEEADVEESENTRCDNSNTVTLDINEHILRYGIIEDDVVAEKFTHKLTRVAQVVHLRPPPYRRIIEQMKEGVKRNKQIATFGDLQIDELVVNDEAIKNYTRVIDMASETALENMEASIHGISTTDGKIVNDTNMIREWLLSLPTDEAEGLTDKINELSKWFTTFSDIKYTCPKCNKEQVFRLELDANRLFGQAGDSIQPKKPSRKSKTGAKKRKVR